MENSHIIADRKAEQVRPPAAQAHPTLSLAQRRAFMQLPLEERRRILAEQAEEMLVHYQQNTEWQELQTSDLIE